MKTLLRITTTILCLSSLQIVGMDKSKIEEHKQFLAQQKQPPSWMRKLNTLLAPTIDREYPSKPASLEDSLLWKQVQKDLGIPEEHFATITEFDATKTNDIKRGIGGDFPQAMMDASIMHVNPELKTKAYGLRRHVFYHEATHYKYLDRLNGWATYKYFNLLPNAMLAAQAIPLSGVVLATSSGFLRKKFASPIAWTCATAASLTSIAATWYLFEHLKTRYIYPSMREFLAPKAPGRERRAELEAAYAVKCHMCTQDVVNWTDNFSPSDKEKRIKSGYLSVEEHSLIAHEQKRMGQICEHHTKLVSENSAPEDKISKFLKIFRF